MSNLNGNSDGSGSVASVAKKRSGRPIDPNSKSLQCRRIYNKMIAEGITDRQIILKAFQDQVDVKPGSAQVYYHEAKNAPKKAAEAAAKAAAATQSSSESVTSTDDSSNSNG